LELHGIAFPQFGYPRLGPPKECLEIFRKCFGISSRSLESFELSGENLAFITFVTPPFSNLPLVT
jgi:hypothetical protein